MTLAVMQKTPDLRLVLMSATGDHQLVRDRIPHCQRLVMKGVMHQVRRYFVVATHGKDTQHAQYDCADCDHLSQRSRRKTTCRPYLPQQGSSESIQQDYGFPSWTCPDTPMILQRALDFGWTEMLIPLPLHGQSSTACVEAVFAEPSVLAVTGKYPLGHNSGIYDEVAFRECEAPPDMRSGLHFGIPVLPDHALSAQMWLNQVSLFRMLALWLALEFRDVSQQTSEQVPV